MTIACVYCGGEHDRPDEVRGCWELGSHRTIRDAPAVETSPRQSGSDIQRRVGDVDSTSAESRHITPLPTSLEFRRGVAVAAAGPDLLGRWALVNPGQLAPEPWAEVDVVVVDAATLADPGDVLATLRAAAGEARRVVVELCVEFDWPIALAIDAEPHRVGARFAFDREELHHLVWSNTVDLRHGSPQWLALDYAVSAGYRPGPGDGSGDLLLADGTAVWLDGGPLRYVAPIDGTPVLHATVVENGGLVENRGFFAAGPNESQADLAPDQLAAVIHDGGAARIVAPAGSGKTRVLTERARHLLSGWRIPPSALTLVAFNKRAQAEMSERTGDLPRLHVRTLNAIGLAIINGASPFAPQKEFRRTIDERDVRHIIGDLVSFPRRRNSDPVAPWIEALSLVRLGLSTPEVVEEQAGGEVEGFAEFWSRWCERLERDSLVDFDEQIYRALRVLLSDPIARRAAQQTCRVLLVDEFQDLTPAHLLLVRLLSAPGGAVFGVGDDDQTIYGYNGADPAWLIEFGELFPSAGDYRLEVNYRSPPGVVEIADRLLRHNRRRVAKSIRARPGRDPTEVGWRIDAANNAVGATMSAVRGALAGGAAPADLSVLARVNAMLVPVQAALISEGIPIGGGVGLEFLERPSVRSMLTWLRLATSDRRFAADDLREAIRRPSRSFPPRIIDWIAEQGYVDELFRLAERLNNERDARRLTELAEDVRCLRQLVESIDATRRGMNRSAQGDDFTAVTQLAALHQEAGTFEVWLRSQLAVPRSADGVMLATVHRVKGEEWPHVVVHHADVEQYPHRLAEDIEEERRLFHVAMTRASRTLTITTGARPSPFVDELTTEPPPDGTGDASQRVPDRTLAPSSVDVSRRSDQRTNPIADLNADAAVRYEHLKALRKKLAAGKPAYVVFDNKTLAAIARTSPTTRQELARISGVGPVKLERYGDEILAALTSKD